MYATKKNECKTLNVHFMRIGIEVGVKSDRNAEKYTESSSRKTAKNCVNRAHNLFESISIYDLRL